MPPAHPSLTPKRERRVQAVLALLHGEPAAQVTVRFGISRSDLYKFGPAGAFEQKVTVLNFPLV